MAGETISQDTRSSALPAPEHKHAFVERMFDSIAPRYDLLNSVLSLRMHHGWRRFAVKLCALSPGDTALDVCTGTGDLAFELARAVGKSGQVIATDFSFPMLALGEKKARARDIKSGPGAASVRMALADTQKLPFPDNSFDAVTVGFGIRNVADIDAGLSEMARVARPGGRVVLLEFNSPTQPIFAAIYKVYSKYVLPKIGGLVSGRRAAYDYLPASVDAFHSRAELVEKLARAGVENVTVTDLTFGTVVVHRGVKANPSPIPPRTEAAL